MERKIETFKIGDKVEWQTPQGKTSGTIKKKLTAPMKIKSHVVAASEENPEYLVETDSGAEAAHKPEALTKIKS